MKQEVNEYISLIRKLAKSGGDQWRTVKTVINTMYSSSLREDGMNLMPERGRRPIKKF